MDLGRSHDHTANHQWKTFKKSQKSCDGLQNQTYFSRGWRYICFGHPGEVVTQLPGEEEAGGMPTKTFHCHAKSAQKHKVAQKTATKLRQKFSAANTESCLGGRSLKLAKCAFDNFVAH